MNKHLSKRIGAVVMLVAVYANAYASPVLESIASGSASISKTSVQTTVTQQSNNVTLNWNSFNVSQNQKIQFVQPNTQSLAINNILDSNPSHIAGQIQANGRVVLLNPNGFYFGANSSVSAHTFIAAATSLSNARFANGRLSPNNNTNNNLRGIIEVHGSIHAHTVQLLAKKIVHTGTIETPHATPHETSWVSLRTTGDITISGSITAPQGTIDIFATNGIAKIDSTPHTLISTKTNNYDYSLSPGFIEFSGKEFQLGNFPFELNTADTLLLDPDYIVIAGGAEPVTCPALLADDCGFETGTTNITDAYDADGDGSPPLGTSYIYENTIEAVTGGVTISLAAKNSISFTGTFTTGLTLVANNSLNLTTTCDGTIVCVDGTDEISITEAITTSGTGTITISSGSSVSITAPVTSAADVTITTGTNSGLSFGNLTINDNALIIGGITAGGSVAITASYGIAFPGTGAITSGASQTITLTSTNGSFGTSINPVTVTQNATTGNIVATALSGSVYLDSAAALSLGSIRSGTAATDIIDITTTGAAIPITLNGNLNVVTSTGDIDLDASGVITQTAASAVYGENISFASGGNIVINSTITALGVVSLDNSGSTSGSIGGSATLHVSSTATITLRSALDLGVSGNPFNILQVGGLAGALTASSENGSIYINSTGGLTLGNIETRNTVGSSAIVITTAGNIIGSAGTAITSGFNSAITLTANNFDVGASVQRLSIVQNATTGNLVISASSIYLEATSNLTTGALTSVNSDATIARTLSILQTVTAPSAITINDVIDFTEGTGTNTVSISGTSGQSSITISSNISADAITANQMVAITLGNTVLNSDSITLSSSGDIINSATGTLQADTYSLTTTGGSIGSTSDPIFINQLPTSFTAAYGAGQTADFSTFSPAAQTAIESGTLTIGGVAFIPPQSHLTITIQGIALSSGVRVCVTPGPPTSNCTFTLVTTMGGIANDSNYTINARNINLVSSADIGSYANPIIISRNEDAADTDHATNPDSGNFNSITLTAPNGTIYIKRANDDVISIFSGLATLSLSGGIVMIQDAGTATANLSTQNIFTQPNLHSYTLVAPSIIIANDLILDNAHTNFITLGNSTITEDVTINAIVDSTDVSLISTTTTGTVEVNSSITASNSVTINTLNNITTTTSGFANYIGSPSLTITSSSGDIGEIDAPILIASGSLYSETAAFTNFDVQASNAYIQRDNGSQTTLNAISSTDVPGTISFTQSSGIFIYNTTGGISGDYIFNSPGGFDITAGTGIGAADNPLGISTALTFTGSQNNLNNLTFLISASSEVFLESNSDANSLLENISGITSVPILGIFQTQGIFVIDEVSVTNNVVYIGVFDSSGTIIALDENSFIEYSEQLRIFAQGGIGTEETPLEIKYKNIGFLSSSDTRLNIGDNSNGTLFYAGDTYLKTTSSIDYVTIRDVHVASATTIEITVEGLLHFQMGSTTNSYEIDWLINLNDANSETIHSVNRLIGNSITFNFMSGYDEGFFHSSNSFVTRVDEGITLIDRSSTFDTTNNIFNAITSSGKISVCDSGNICRTGGISFGEMDSLEVAFEFINISDIGINADINLDINTSGSSRGDTLLINAPLATIYSLPTIYPTGNARLRSGRLVINAEHIGTDSNALLFEQSTINPGNGVRANAYFRTPFTLFIGANTDLGDRFCTNCVDVFFVNLTTGFAITNSLLPSRTLSIVQAMGDISNSGGFNISFSNRNCDTYGEGCTLPLPANNQFVYNPPVSEGVTVGLYASGGSVVQSIDATHAFIYNGRFQLRAQDQIGSSTSAVQVDPGSSEPPLQLLSGSTSCNVSTCGNIYVFAGSSSDITTSVDPLVIDFARVTSNPGKSVANVIEISTYGRYRNLELYGNSPATLLEATDNTFTQYRADGEFHIADWTLFSEHAIYALSDYVGYISGSQVHITARYIGHEPATSSPDIASIASVFAGSPTSSLSATFEISDASIDTAIKVGLIATDGNAHPSLDLETMIWNGTSFIQGDELVANIYYDASRENSSVPEGTCGGTIQCLSDFDLQIGRYKQQFPDMNSYTSEGLGTLTFGTINNYLSITSISGAFTIPVNLSLAGSGDNVVSLIAFGTPDEGGISCIIITIIIGCTTGITANEVTIRANGDIGSASTPLIVNATTNSFVSASDIYLEGANLFNLYSGSVGNTAATVQFVNGSLNSDASFTIDVESLSLSLDFVNTHTLYLKSSSNTAFSATNNLTIDRDTLLGTGSKVNLTVEVDGTITHTYTGTPDSAVDNVLDFTLIASGHIGTSANPLAFSIEGNLIVDANSGGSDAYLRSLGPSKFLRIQANNLYYEANSDILQTISVESVYNNGDYLISAQDIHFAASEIGSEFLPITVDNGPIAIVLQVDAGAGSIFLDSFSDIEIHSATLDTQARFRPLNSGLLVNQSSALGATGLASDSIQFIEDNSGVFNWGSVGLINSLLLSSSGSSPVLVEIITRSASLSDSVDITFASDATIQLLDTGKVMLRASVPSITLARGTNPSESIVANLVTIEGSNLLGIGTENEDIDIGYRDSDYNSSHACFEIVCFSPLSATDIYARITDSVSIYHATINVFAVDSIYLSVEGDASHNPFNIDDNFLIAANELYVAIDSGTENMTANGGEFISSRIGLYNLNSNIGSSSNPITVRPYTSIASPVVVSFDVSIRTNRNAHVQVADNDIVADKSNNRVSANIISMRLVDTFERARENYDETIFNTFTVDHNGSGDIEVAAPIAFGGLVDIFANGDIVSSEVSGVFGRLLVYIDNAVVKLEGSNLGRNPSDRLCIGDYSNLQLAQSKCNFQSGALAEHQFSLEAIATDSIFLDISGLRGELTSATAVNVIDILLRGNTPDLEITGIMRSPIVRVQVRANLDSSGALVCSVGCAGGIVATSAGGIESNDVSLLVSGGSIDETLYSNVNTFVPIVGYGVGSLLQAVKITPYDTATNTVVQLRAVGSSVFVATDFSFLLEAIRDIYPTSAWQYVSDYISTYLVSVISRERVELIADGGIFISATSDQTNTILAQEILLESGANADIGNYQTISGSLIPERFISLRLPFSYSGSGNPASIGSSILLEASGNSIAIESFATLVFPEALDPTIPTIFASKRFDVRLNDTIEGYSNLTANEGHEVVVSTIAIEAENGSIASSLFPLFLVNNQGSLSLSVRAGNAYIIGNSDVTLIPIQSLSSSAVYIQQTLETEIGSTVVTPGEFILTISGSSSDLTSLLNPSDLGVTAGFVSISATGDIGSEQNPISLYNVGPIVSNPIRQCADGDDIIACDSILLSLSGNNGFIDTHALKTVLASASSFVSPIHFSDRVLIRGYSDNALFLPSITNDGIADIQANRITLQFELGDIGYFSVFEQGLPKSLRLGLPDGSTQTGIIIENNPFTKIDGTISSEGVYGRSVSLVASADLYLTGEALYASSRTVLRTSSTTNSSVHILQNPNAIDKSTIVIKTSNLSFLLDGNLGERIYVGSFEDTSRFIQVAGSVSDSVQISGNADNVYIISQDQLTLIEDTSNAGLSISALAANNSGVIRIDLGASASLSNGNVLQQYPLASGEVIVTGSGAIGSASSPVGLTLATISSDDLLSLSATGSTIAFTTFVPLELTPFSFLQTSALLQQEIFSLGIITDEFGNRAGDIVLESRGTGSSITGYGDILAGYLDENYGSATAGSIYVTTEGAMSIFGNLYASTIELNGIAILDRSIASVESLTIAWAANTLGTNVGSSSDPIKIHAPENSNNQVTLRASGANIYLVTSATLYLPEVRSNEIATIRILPQLYNFGNLALHDAFVHGTVRIISSAVASEIVDIIGPGSIYTGYIPNRFYGDNLIPILDPLRGIDIAIDWENNVGNYNPDTGLISIEGVETYTPLAGIIEINISGSILMFGDLVASDITLASINGDIGQSNTITIGSTVLEVPNVIYNNDANPLLYSADNPLQIQINAIKLIRPGIPSETITQTISLSGNNVYVQSINSSLSLNNISLSKDGVLEVTTGEASIIRNGIQSGLSYRVYGSGSIAAHRISINASGTIGFETASNSNLSLLTQSSTSFGIGGTPIIEPGSIYLSSLFGSIGNILAPVRISSNGTRILLSAWAHNALNTTATAGSVYITSSQIVSLVLPESVDLESSSVGVSFEQENQFDIVEYIPSLKADSELYLISEFGYDIIGGYDDIASSQLWQSAFAKNKIVVLSGGNLFTTGELVAPRILLQSENAIGKESIDGGQVLFYQGSLTTSFFYSNAVKVSPIYNAGELSKQYFIDDPLIDDDGLVILSGSQGGNIFLQARTDIYLDAFVHHNPNAQVELYAVGEYETVVGSDTYVYGAHILNRLPAHNPDYDSIATLTNRFYDYGSPFFTAGTFTAYASGDIGAISKYGDSYTAISYGLPDSNPQFDEPIRVQISAGGSLADRLSLTASSNITIDLTDTQSQQVFLAFDSVFHFSDRGTPTITSDPASHLLNIRQLNGGITVDSIINFEDGSVHLRSPFGSITGNGSISTVGLVAGLPSKAGIMLEARDTIQLSNLSVPITAYFLIIRTELASLAGDVRAYFNPSNPNSIGGNTLNGIDDFETDIGGISHLSCFTAGDACVFNTNTVSPRFLFVTEETSRQIAFLSITSAIDIYYDISNPDLADVIFINRDYFDPKLSVLSAMKSQSELHIGPIPMSPLEFQADHNPFQDTELVPSEVVGLCKSDIVNRYDFINENYVVIGCTDAP